ncbi:hypothetical protein QP525_011615 [Prevotella bivia]|nr:hypothetical protein [Prevotella bivia]MDZ3818802.1 hypothetical protein [Prevotella bivia]
MWYQTQLIKGAYGYYYVVICLKISIFVVSNTTNTGVALAQGSCDLLENFYLCGIKHNSNTAFAVRIAL